MIQFCTRRLLVALGRFTGGLVFLVLAVELAMLLARTRGAVEQHVAADIVALFNGSAKWGGEGSETSIFAEVAARSASSGGILLGASIIAIGLGIPLGIALAKSQRTRGATEFLMLPIALLMWMPAFWMACLAVLFLVNVWEQPAYGVGRPGIEAWWRLFVPALIIGVGSIGWQIRSITDEITQAMNVGHVRAAHIRGHHPRLIFFQGVFRNSLDPIVRGISRSLPVMLGSLIIVEWVFRYPGVGAMTLEAAREANFAGLMMCGVSMLFLVVMVRCGSEIVHGILDPELIKKSGKNLELDTEPSIV